LADTVAGRIDGGDDRLTAVELKCGSNLCIIDIVAPFGGEAEMRDQIDLVQSGPIKPNHVGNYSTLSPASIRGRSL